MTAAEQLMRALSGVQDPEIRRPLTELDMIPSARVDDGIARIRLELTIATCPAADRIEADVRAAALSVDGIEGVEIDVGVMDPATRRALTERLRGSRPIQFGAHSLTRVIAITSGKGGVGKSTVTANLAVELARRGQRVGLVDADVHGYSIPGLLGLDDQPTKVGDLMMPPTVHGVSVISIGMFVEGNQSVSWRGQLLPKAEVVVVTTPQRAAADVSERSALVARQTGQSVLGVVENMAGLAQSDGSVLELFGSGGGDEVAQRLGVPVLARVPISVPLREGGDVGSPIVLTDAADAGSQAVRALADALDRSRPPLSGRGIPLAPRKG